jgi:hypothetical protein
MGALQVWGKEEILTAWCLFSCYLIALQQAEAHLDSFGCAKTVPWPSIPPLAETGPPQN